MNLRSLAWVGAFLALVVLLVIPVTLSAHGQGAGEYRIWLPLIVKPRPSNPIHHGIATYYESDGNGACNFGPSPNQMMVASISIEEYNQAAVCGEYVHVIGAQGSVTVLIVGFCPGCEAGHLDLSHEAFALIAGPGEGLVDITWQVVSPELAGPISYYFMNSTQNWEAVQLRNHRNPIASLEYFNDAGQWVSIPRVNYNFFVQSDPGMGPGPYSFRVTDSYGHVLIDHGILLVENGTVPGSAQFPPGP